MGAMDQLGMKSVAKLDLEHTEQDFERWSLEVIEICKRAGHGALEALQLGAGVEVPPPPAEGDPLADALTELSIPQTRQAAVRSLIANSLPASEEPGSPRHLIRDMVNAGGSVAGVSQAWLALTARYSVAKVPEDRGALLLELMASNWPKKLNVLEYQAFHLSKCADAGRIGLNPDGDSAADVASRDLWWAAIGRPPPASPYAAIVKRVRTETRDLHETVAQREQFHTIMLREVQLEALEVDAGRKQRRALEATAECEVVAAAPEMERHRRKRGGSAFDGMGPGGAGNQFPSR